MDITFILSLIASLLYAIEAYRHWGDANNEKNSRHDQIVALVAIACHWAITIDHTVLNDGYMLSFTNTASIVAVFIATLVFVASLRMPINSLASPTYGIALIIVIMMMTQPFRLPKPSLISAGLLSHVLLSLLAYSTFTIAALHAVLLAAQEQRLKRRQTSKLLSFLPSLQTMENLLFKMIWAGQTLLTTGIISGMIFLQDIFAQHLVHKTILSLAAWLIFGALLWGRHVSGWRGNTAVKFTLGGFAILMLAYFGSKLVLEIILQRV